MSVDNGYHSAKMIRYTDIMITSIKLSRAVLHACQLTALLLVMMMGEAAALEGNDQTIIPVPQPESAGEGDKGRPVEPDGTASGSNSGENTSRYNSEESDADILYTLDEPHQFASHSLLRLATIIDEFFSDEKAYYTASGSYASIAGDTIWRESEEAGYSAKLRIKLDLPNTRKRIKFFILSDPGEDKDAIDKALDPSPAAAAENSQYFAGLQKESGRPNKWLLRSRIGFKVRSPVDTFIRFDARRTYQLNAWSMHLNEAIYWFARAGKGLETGLEFDHAIHDHAMFRAGTEFSWVEENSYIDVSQEFWVFHRIGQRNIIAYQIGAYGITEPVLHSTDYLVSLRYRRNVHKNYLFVELVPQVRYQKINDFVPENSILLRLEIIFRG